MSFVVKGVCGLLTVTPKDGKFGMPKEEAKLKVAAWLGMYESDKVMIKSYVVSCEGPHDGAANDHIHIAILFDHQVRFVGKSAAAFLRTLIPSFPDAEMPAHPDWRSSREYMKGYEGCHGFGGCIAYVTKRDPDPVASEGFDYKMYMNASKVKSSTNLTPGQMGMAAMSGKSATAAFTEGIICDNQIPVYHRIRAILSEDKANEEKKKLVIPTEFDFKIYYPDDTSEVLRRVKFPALRQDGPSIFWLWGPPYTGKTSVVKYLRTDDGLPISYWSAGTEGNEFDMTNYAGERIIYFEDVDLGHSVSYNTLVLLTEGSEFKRKYLPKYKLPPYEQIVVVSSNKHPDEVYCKTSTTDPKYNAATGRMWVHKMTKVWPGAPAARFGRETESAVLSVEEVKPVAKRWCDLEEDGIYLWKKQWVAPTHEHLFKEFVKDQSTHELDLVEFLDAWSAYRTAAQEKYTKQREAATAAFLARNKK